MKILLSVLAFCLFAGVAFGTNFSGNYTIGVSGNYQTITAAANALKTVTNTVTGNCVFELLSDYNPASETYPILIKQFVASNSSYTVTFRPQSGVSSVVNQAANTTAILSLDSADKYIFDGRAGGSGGSIWIFRNTRTASNFGTVIRLLNGATYNTLTYLTVESQSTSVASGNIYFQGTTNTNGNSYNEVSYCILRNRSDVGTNYHAIGIYAAGNTTYQNTANSITNCEFFNHYNATSSSYAIYINTGNTDFTISDNKIYQPSTLTVTAGNLHMGIRVSNSNGNNFTISNNSIGYASNSATGSTTYNGNFNTRYTAIYLTLGTSTVSSIQNNRIANFDITTTSNYNAAYGAFTGIYLTEGKANIGNITGNYIGDTASGSNILITKNIDDRNYTIIQGIGSTSTSTVTISNNKIGGFRIVDGDDSTNMSFYGICTSGTNGNYTIENNKIGSLSDDNNIELGQTSFSNGNHRAYCIYNSATGIIQLNNNCISNIISYGTGVSYSSFGIYTSGGVNTINNNQISNIKNYSKYNTGTSLPAIIGISKNVALNGSQSINNNLIFNLICSNNSGANIIVGIFANGPVSNTLDVNSNTIYNLQMANSSTSSAIYGLYVNSGSGKVEKNFIHSLSNAGSAATIYGIRILNGDHTYQKNMIRLGIDGSANSITSGCSIYGIYKSSTLNLSNKFYFNSIYIGGTNVDSTTSNTTCFYRYTNSTVDYVQNNIFVNNRSNTVNGGKHYCYILNGTSAANFDYNLYNNTGTGGNIASLNNGTTARLTLKTVRENFNLQELHSAFGDPNFINATGNSSSVNLHLSGTTAAEGSGILVSGVTDDFDGNTLSSYTPTDIGADAGNFTASDLFTPNLNFSDLSNTSSMSNRTLSGVTISDVGSGVPTSGSNVPQIWYRISTGTPTAWVHNDGTLSSGTGNDGVWSFVLDYSKLSRSVATNDRIQYYLVVQDQASTPNIWYSPFIGASHSNVSTQTTAPTTPKSYLLTGTGLSGTYTIGSGGDYASLTSTGGFFAACNATTVSGNITLSIISNLTETGANGLNQLSMNPSGSSFTVTIVPSASTERVISCSSNSAMIRLLGVDSLTIDGSYGGSGRYLRFRNTYGSQSTLLLQEGSRYNVFENCIFEGPASSSVINFSTSASASTGNSNNLINNCLIRDRSDVSGIPSNAIYSNGTATSGLENKDNSITNCEITNYNSNGIIITSSGNAGGWIITDNHFYNSTGSSSLQQISINLQSVNTSNNSITGNYIGGSASNCGGSAWTNSGAITYYGIYLSSGTGNIIDGNTIQNISLTSTAAANFYGIYISVGDAQIGTSIGNLIGDASTSNSINISGTGTVCGIYAALGVIPIKNNIIANISQGNSKPGLMMGIYSYSNNTYTIELNKIYKIGSTTADSTGSSTIGIRVGSSGSGTLITVKTNQISIGQSTNNTREYYGIYYDATSGNTLKAYYNSVFITGTCASSTFISSAFRKTTSGAIDLRNNILYNNRSGSSSANYAIWHNNSGTITSNYNLMVSANSAKMACYGTTAYTYATYISTTNFDRHSWPFVSSNVTYSNLFTNALNCDLSIRNDMVEAWYAHGNGEVITSISKDFDGNTRQNVVGNGVTDIGAFEFNIVSKGAPPTLTESGTIVVGGTTTYTLGEKTLASIYWNSGTSLPTTVEIAYHSGEVAADLPNYPDGKYSFAYFSASQTGGTTYNYNITQYYSDAALSRFQDIANELSITRAQNGSDWTERPTDLINTTTKTVRITNQTGFGVYSFTAQGEGGLLPIELVSFSGKVVNNFVELSWTTLTETNNDFFELHRSLDGVTFEKIQYLKGAGNSTKPINYSCIDYFPATSLNYYRLKQTDYDGNFSFSKTISVRFNSNIGEIAIIPISKGSAICKLNLMDGGNIVIKIYSLNGRELINRNFLASKGLNSIKFNNLPSGELLLFRIETKEEEETVKYFGL